MGNVDLAGLVEAQAITLDFAFFGVNWRVRADDVIMTNLDWFLAIASAERYGVRVYARVLATGDCADLAKWTVVDVGPLALTPEAARTAQTSRVRGLDATLERQERTC